MTTTPQPIQQQAFSFTPPGTFSQGFGFVPTRLRIDNPSSYYLSFPKVPSLGLITPYTFGAVVPWNQSDGTVTITTDYTPKNAPTLVSSNAEVTVLATTDMSYTIQPGISSYGPSTPTYISNVTITPGSTFLFPVAGQSLQMQKLTLTGVTNPPTSSDALVYGIYGTNGDFYTPIVLPDVMQFYMVIDFQGYTLQNDVGLECQYISGTQPTPTPSIIGMVIFSAN